MDSRIENWIKENKGGWDLETESWNFPEDIRILDYLIENGRLLIRFGIVDRNFSCYNNSLTSLDGCPKKVGGFFNCSNNQLTSLEGAPKKVSKYFDCAYNLLTSLEGCPNEVGEWFECFNNQLRTLEGCPKKVGRYFGCLCNPLKSVSRIFDSEISGEFYIDNMFSNLQLDESNQFLIEAANILKNRFEQNRNKLMLKTSRESLEELEDILKTAEKLKFKS